MNNSEKDITFVFIKFMHQVLKNEKRTIIEKRSYEIIQRKLEQEYLTDFCESQVNTFPIIVEWGKDSLENYIENCMLSNLVEVLTEKEKYILLRRFVHNEKDPEVGRKLGISSQAMSKQRRKVLKKLRNELESIE